MTAESEQTTLPPPRPKRFGKSALGAEVFSVTPFSRLLRAHVLSAGGYAATVLALADSVFFSVDPSDARWRVMLGLLLTMAPFAFIAQFLGPLIERVPGGNRFVLISSYFLRGIIVLLMASQVKSLLFFPLTFGFLVADRTYIIAKSAVVPAVIVDDAHLVRANSRLQISGSLGGAALVPIAGLLVFLGPVLNGIGFSVSETLGGASWGLVYAGMLFTIGGVLALQIPGVATPESSDPDSDRNADISLDPAMMTGRGGILLSSSAMAYMRAVVGFVIWLLAFEVRGGVDPGPQGVGVEMGHRVRESMGLERLDLAVGGAPTWHLGAIGAASVIGAATGSLLSPKLREQFSEDRNIAGMLGLISVVGLLGALLGGLAGSVAVAVAVGLGGSAGKQSFDAIVQRDTPHDQLGASFAKFESRFQLVWVLGALIPVILPIPARLGFLIVAVTAGFAAVSYWLGKDPAPNTEVARRRAAAASARATESVRQRAASRTPRRRKGGTATDGTATDGTAAAPPPDPTVEHPGMADNFEPTTEMSVHKAALTDTQPVPIVRIDAEGEVSDGADDG
ncbi:MAG: hypothetical protein ACN4GZ_20565 [Acidimicrobiales bacterium]